MTETAGYWHDMHQVDLRGLLPPVEAVARVGIGLISTAVSGESLAMTETARYSACNTPGRPVRFTASSRSSGSHRDWTHLHGGIWREFGDDRNRRVFDMIFEVTRNTSTTESAVRVNKSGCRNTDILTGGGAPS
jgi:hypothetical protein